MAEWFTVWVCLECNSNIVLGSSAIPPPCHDCGSPKYPLLESGHWVSDGPWWKFWGRKLELYKEKEAGDG